MMRIGVIVAYNSLEEIKPVEDCLRGRCELTFFTYKKLTEIKKIYLENQFLYDGIVMNGLAYFFLKKDQVEFQTPTFNYMISERDFYKSLFKISTIYKDIDFSRVSFDFIGSPGNLFGLDDIFSDDHFPCIIQGEVTEGNI
ncbi:hypothetical protein [Peribacillus sp. NPDC097895]|uniref:hypothetical protein n=1 Tax=Peribacillus sp. NPDC097895 TaxID=3390619 RepID=UPI003D0652E2